MKYFGALFVATLFFVLVHSAPRVAPDSEESSDASNKRNTDTVIVLPESNRGISKSNIFADVELPGVVDDPFDFDIFRSFRDRFWEQMRQAAEFFKNSQNGFGVFGKVPEGGNKTSTTKIIDGHVVTINDTTYSDGDENNGSFFRVRVVDIKPQNGTLQIGGNPDAESIPLSNSGKEPESTTPPRSVETLEDDDNEISNGDVETLTA